MFEFLYKSFILLFLIIDPIGLMPFFIGLTKNVSKKRHKQIAIKAVLIAVILLVIFAVIGHLLLEVIGVSTAAFKIAGGLLLLMFGFSMVMPKENKPSDDDISEKDLKKMEKEDVSVFPLAFPLIAGPGALTTVIVVMREAENTMEHIGILVSLLLIGGITFCLLSISSPVSKLLGDTGANIMTRILGVLVAAIAMSFIIGGLQESFNFAPTVRIF
ncbi:MAG: MarC family protein [Alphaproteobacteria bacterium]|nr:MarC family protein [Alphaproteobacteria bacterium]MBT5390392.1 MarC family protein [Alphaproteobacteria bacterium]MBT5540369.1 MarC family protein [Alphaproteobacteria bacterium]MBT5654159.1 MarC family protein [Alphaproteobacteria bacterium]